MTLFARILLIFVSTGLFLALAIAGEGGFRPFFSQPALVALVVVTLLLCIASLFTNANVSSGVREDRGNRWVFVAFMLLGILLGILPAWTDRLDFWTIDGDTARWTGVVLYALGGVLRLWPVFVLGNRFSGLVAIQKDHKLETGNIYRFIRHPSYVGLVLICAGWALAFRSGIGLLITALILVVLVGRIRSEEALLRSEFGAEYEAYAKRTARFIPGVF